MIPLDDWTNLQRLRKRLYRIHDVRLIVPVAAVQAAAFVGVLAATFLVLRTFGVPFVGRTTVLYFGPALGAGKLADADEIEGRSLWAWMLARGRYVCAPRLVVA